MVVARDGNRLGFDRWNFVFVAIAIGVAALGARPYAGSWNDGSRLAAVESLVDHHTWAIDDSIFVTGTTHFRDASPYPASELELQRHGTRDKMWINGHFYSDKSPVPNLCLAIVYRCIQLISGLSAREQPDWFCYWMALASSGLAYVISVYCIDRLSVVHRLSQRTRILVTFTFAFGTIALAYARQVNSHVVLLAVCSALVLFFSNKERFSKGELIVIGSLLGAGYTLDVVIGSTVVVGTLFLLVARRCGAGSLFVVLAAAFPWFALHHALNYMIAGTFLPANANPAFFRWPDSPFTDESLTGGWHHHSAYSFAGYALDLLVGHRGFLLCNLPVLLALPGAVWLLRRHAPERNEVWFAIGVTTLSWLLYATFSNNHAGLCCSVRWFVPLLAPLYGIVVILLRNDTSADSELRILAPGGVILGALMWWQGPWSGRLVPGFWFIVGITCVTWIVYRIGRSRRVAKIIN